MVCGVNPINGNMVMAAQPAHDLVVRIEVVYTDELWTHILYVQIQCSKHVIPIQIDSSSPFSVDHVFPVVRMFWLSLPYFLASPYLDQLSEWRLADNWAKE